MQSIGFYYSQGYFHYLLICPLGGSLLFRLRIRFLKPETEVSQLATALSIEISKFDSFDLRKEYLMSLGFSEIVKERPKSQKLFLFSCFRSEQKEKVINLHRDLLSRNVQLGFAYYVMATQPAIESRRQRAIRVPTMAAARSF